LFAAAVAVVVVVGAAGERPDEAVGSEPGSVDSSQSWETVRTGECHRSHETVGSAEEAVVQ